MKKHSLLQNKKCHKIVAFLLMLVLAVSVISTTAMAEPLQNAPYDTYTYWTAPGTRWSVSSTPMYEYETTITGDSLGITTEGTFGAAGNDFSEPADLCTDKDGNIYLLDTDNGRVVVINPDYTLNKVIKPKGSNPDEEISINGARGLFVTEDKRIYVADSENARVLVFDINGKVLGEVLLPDAQVIPDNYDYIPVRIAVDSKNFLYVLSEGSYYGALLYKPTNSNISKFDYSKDYEFTGFYGANSTTGGVLDALSQLYEMLFVSDEAKENQVATLPYSFTDITVDKEDFIYTATGAISTQQSSTGQLKKLSPGGTNVLKNKTKSVVSSAESTDFADGRGIKTQLASGSYGWRTTDLSSMDVDSDGFMYGLCSSYGHVFIYDQDCNLLTVFGSGLNMGEQKGTFYKASTIHVDDTIDPKTGEATDKVYIVDSSNASITVYRETEYGKIVKRAQKTTNSGDYVAAKDDWNKVLTYDRNQQLAYRGLAKAALIEEEYELTLEYSELGFDPDTYASAYTFVRNNWLTNNFSWLIILAVVVLGGIVAFLIISKKRGIKLINNVKLKTMFECVYHPFQGAGQVRYYNKGSARLATGVLVVYLLSAIISEMYTGFMYNIFDKSSYNVLFTIARSVGIVLLWTVANWAMSTLFQGKGNMKHVYIVTCYALIPLIVSNILQAILTNFMTPEEALVISAINLVCLAFTAIMLTVGTMTVHEYGFFKFLIMSVVVVFAMLVIVFVMLMVFVLLQQAFGFVGTLINEVTYR